MVYAFGTTLLWALSPFFAREALKHLGLMPVMFARLSLSGLVTGLVVWAGSSVRWDEASLLMAASGSIGIAIGDTAFLYALPRINPQRASLIVLCLSAPLAAVVEFTWLGTALQLSVIGAAALIIVGVAMALAAASPDPKFPSSARPLGTGEFWAGCAWCAFGAFAMALGAVLSRVSYEAATNTGYTIDGWAATFLRMAGALACMIAIVGGRMILRPGLRLWYRPTADGLRSGIFWVCLATTAGPLLGIVLYQIALQTVPAGIALAIVALSPLLATFIAWGIDGERPTFISIIGTLLAILGVVLLVIART